jgi:PTH2 family peptidyl-tRNA hydrolase
VIILNKTSPELILPEADPVSMYIIVNADLQLSPAKLAVQIGHGVELHFKEMWLKTNLEFSDEYRKYVEPHRQWMDSGSRKIVLKANPSQWKKIKECSEIEGYLVIDAGLTECDPNTETCIVLPPKRKSQCHKLVKKLQLL